MSNTPLHTSPGRALVTGASSGIGARYAHHLAHRGHDLTLVARNVERLETLAARLRAETGRDVRVLPADLSRADGVQRVAQALREDDSLTLLVNNAGIGAVAPLLQSDSAQMQAMIDLNISALTHLTMAAAPAFVARRRHHHQYRVDRRPAPRAAQRRLRRQQGLCAGLLAIVAP